MNREELEQLLYEEEGPTLDFKRDQYGFVRASNDQKSELLKDILGFVNCWRRADAFILIGVEEVQGGRGIVHGISDHLQDHSLQQFINNLTNRPVQFGYEACEIEGKQVGVIRIELQRRPAYLKRDYGKLTKGKVYVRRGSSTDPTKPADPDEIADMGSGQVAGAKEASLAVEFADPNREQRFGSQIDWSAEFCEMPDSDAIPTLTDRPASIRLPGGRTLHIPSASTLRPQDCLNPRFYHDLRHYIFVHKLFRKVRLVVMNQGDAPATDVRLEICAPQGQGFGIISCLDFPEIPERRYNVVATAAERWRVRPVDRHDGNVNIDQNDHQTKVEIDCGNLQPGRRVWTDCFYIGVGQSGEVPISGYIFAANLPQPQAFNLVITTQIVRIKMTTEQLVALAAPDDDGDRLLRDDRLQR